MAGDLDVFEAERFRPRPSDTSMRQDHSEDSYEAALRAADALFARPKQQFAEPSAPAFETLPESGDATPPSASPERGGRILRVLNEAPSPQLAALEAEHAPKRRGRKPGSKNKPKLAPVEPSGLPQEKPVLTAMLRRKPSSRPVPLTATPQPAPASTAPAVRTLEAIPAAGPRPEQSQRFSWVRDRLKPGENWKRRRLPRICW